MDSFQNLTRMDRRKFLASLLAIAASAGVLGKLGLTHADWTAAKAKVWWESWSDAPLASIMPGTNDTIKFRFFTDECAGTYEVPERIVSSWISKRLA